MFYQHRACIETIILQLLSTLPWQISRTIQTHDWKIFISTIHLLTPCHHLCNFLIRPIYFCDECIDIFRWYCLSQFDLVWFLGFSVWIWDELELRVEAGEVVQEMLSHPRTFLALYRPETLNILWEFEQSEPRFRSFHGWAMLPCWLGWWPLESSRRWRSPLTRTEKLPTQPPSSQYTKHPENVSFFSHKDCLLKMATLTYILHMDKNINQTSTNMTRGGREEMDDAFTHTI